MPQDAAVSQNQESPSLVIDLTNAQQATVLDASSILHKVQLDAFLQRVSEVVQRVDSFKKQLPAHGDKVKGVGYARHHDVITVHGKRGSGKTTFLLSALTLLQNDEKRAKVLGNDKAKNDALNDLCVLEIMDPTLFGLHEHLLLSLLGKIAQKVCARKKSTGAALCDAASTHCDMEQWEKSLRSLAKGLKYIGETRDDLNSPIPHETVRWEDPDVLLEEGMDNARHGVELERQFHIFLNNSLKILDKKAFVLVLDDIDTRPTIGWHVLEVLRRYFTSPQLVVIISGDMDLFKKLIEKWQLEIFGLNFTSSQDVLKEFKPRVDGLTEQYLLKILRTPSRINLGSFGSALHQWEKRYRVSKPIVSKNSKKFLLDIFLKENITRQLACYTDVEQKLFCQALYANPARSVTQVLDAFVGYNEDEIATRLQNGLRGYCIEEITTRLREVFFIPLQNLGFEHSFDLAEALQTPLGIKILMKQLFTHGFVARGLDLLPSRSEQSENNALLALQAELTQAMHGNPAVLFAYIFKACLLRQVLIMQGFVIDNNKENASYANLETYLALETQEISSTTVSRISALHWGDPRANNALCQKGLLRLYAASITKSAPDAMRAMYGATVEELETLEAVRTIDELEEFRTKAKLSGLKDSYRAMRNWINTPETLRDTVISWHRDLVNVGIVNVRRGSNNYRAFSIFSLLAVMSDVLECEEETLSSLLEQYVQAPISNVYGANASLTPQREVGTIEDREEGISLPTLAPDTLGTKNTFTERLEQWRRGENFPSVLTSVLTPALPATLCARIMVRFFSALERIEEKILNANIFVGTYIHRCLVAFFNSVLVEEFLLRAPQNSDIKLKILLENPVTSDSMFLKNILGTQALREFNHDNSKKDVTFKAIIDGEYVRANSLSPEYPLFRTVFTFPLWGFYLKPEETLASDSSNSVYGIYMRLQPENLETAKAMYAIAYNTPDVTFPNMYPLLNSLAIAKAAEHTIAKKTVKSEIETLTSEGKRAKLAANPKSLTYKKIINDIKVNEPSLLEDYRGVTGPMPEEFSDSFHEIIDRYYTDVAQNSRFRTDEECRKFWGNVKKYTKSWN